MAKEKKISTTVVRVKRDTLKKIEKMKLEGEKSAEYLERIVDIFETIVSSDNLYVVDTGDVVGLSKLEVYRDIADARGAAIVHAVRNNETPTMPRIAVVIGADDGN